MRALIEANRLEPPYRLRPGQELTIPKTRTHRVQKGESLYGVSRKYGAEITMLASLNGLGAPYTIYEGQELRLPATSISDEPWALPSGGVTKTTPPASGPKQIGGTPVPQPKPPLPAPPKRGNGKFLWPAEGSVISKFGPKEGGLHNDGINIKVASGTSVRAADNGVVAYVGNELKGYGQLLLVRHSDGFVTAYAHNSKLLVKRGDTVKRGQVISESGRTGSVTEPQIHFEVRKGSKALDPAIYLS